VSTGDARRLPAEQDCARLYEDLLRREGLGVIRGSEATRRGGGANNGRRASDVPEAAAFWAKVGMAASDLPRNHRGRRFIITAAETGNMSAAARRTGMSRMEARWVFRQFLVANGLGASRTARSVRSGTPGAERERRRRG
jgi:hypothetical protein